MSLMSYSTPSCAGTIETEDSALVTSAPLTVIYKVVEMLCSRAIAKVRTETLIAFAVPICVRIAL